MSHHDPNLRGPSQAGLFAHLLASGRHRRAALLLERLDSAGLDGLTAQLTAHEQRTTARLAFAPARARRLLAALPRPALAALLGAAEAPDARRALALLPAATVADLQRRGLSVPAAREPRARGNAVFRLRRLFAAAR